MLVPQDLKAGAGTPHSFALCNQRVSSDLHDCLDLAILRNATHTCMHALAPLSHTATLAFSVACPSMSAFRAPCSLVLTSTVPW